MSIEHGEFFSAQPAQYTEFICLRREVSNVTEISRIFPKTAGKGVDEGGTEAAE